MAHHTLYHTLGSDRVCGKVCGKVFFSRKVCGVTTRHTHTLFPPSCKVCMHVCGCVRLCVRAQGQHSAGGRGSRHRGRVEWDVMSSCVCVCVCVCVCDAPTPAHPRHLCHTTPRSPNLDPPPCPKPPSHRRQPQPCPRLPRSPSTANACSRTARSMASLAHPHAAPWGPPKGTRRVRQLSIDCDRERERCPLATRPHAQPRAHARSPGDR